MIVMPSNHLCFLQLLEGNFAREVSHEVDGLIFQPTGVSCHDFDFYSFAYIVGMEIHGLVLFKIFFNHC